MITILVDYTCIDAYLICGACIAPAFACINNRCGVTRLRGIDVFCNLDPF